MTHRILYSYDLFTHRKQHTHHSWLIIFIVHLIYAMLFTIHTHDSSHSSLTMNSSYPTPLTCLSNYSLRIPNTLITHNSWLITHAYDPWPTTHANHHSPPLTHSFSFIYIIHSSYPTHSSLITHPTHHPRSLFTPRPKQHIIHHPWHHSPLTPPSNHSSLVTSLLITCHSSTHSSLDTSLLITNLPMTHDSFQTIPSCIMCRTGGVRNYLNIFMLIKLNP